MFNVFCGDARFTGWKSSINKRLPMNNVFDEESSDALAGMPKAKMPELEGLLDLEEHGTQNHHWKRRQSKLGS